ncbi:iron-sulfur cluster assembly scaffold protein [Pontixanthobacter sp.]|uniref:iron-sulfur cluster assembly scaffold protein n=1 Tax=Pontixanthobacter sp. TaxID=2792078 RepID=UPI003C7D1DAA
MATGNSAKLYTPDVLALAVDLANYPLLGVFECTAEARSSTCGSTISLGLNIDPYGTVSKIGLSLSACAIGQASAALFARSVTGMSTEALIRQSAQIEAWLNGYENPPEIPSFDLIVPARSYPARRGALLLPWRAAQRALSNGLATG